MLTTFYPPYSFGGDAIGTQRVANALAERGHEVTVIHDEDAFSTLRGIPGKEEVGGARPTRIGLRSRMGPVSNLLTQQLGHPVVHGGKIREILGDGRFDIVWHNNASLVTGPGFFGVGGGLQVYEAHEHWLVCPMHVLWRYNRELCDEKRCVSCSLSFRRPPQLWRYTGYLDRKARDIDIFIAKSQFSRDMHARFGFRHPMETVPYFLPDAEVAKSIPDRPKPYFLFVGRLEKIKGLQDVIPHFAQQDAADLVIIGDGDYRPELERLSNGAKSVEFLGRMPPDQLAEWYKGAVAMVMPSVCYETFGIVLIESFRMGTPVIARRLGPMPEIVDQSNGGLLFETSDEFVAATRRFLEDPGFRDRAARSAREAFLANWSESPVLRRYGRKFADAAARTGKTELAKRLRTGLLENGPGSA
jgi:glycosyltransferase involved in cell wall biosynthesis